jgi:hypothetical protein
MARNFSKTVHFDGKAAFAVFVPHRRPDGLYYEVNINGFPRFFMAWSPLGRYDVVDGDDLKLPYSLILGVSDVLEGERKLR